MANQNEKILLDLLKLEGNDVCADCGKKGKEKKSMVCIKLRICFDFKIQFKNFSFWILF